MQSDKISQLCASGKRKVENGKWKAKPQCLEAFVEKKK